MYEVTSVLPLHVHWERISICLGTVNMLQWIFLNDGIALMYSLWIDW